MKWPVTVQEAVTGISLTYLPIMAANDWFIGVWVRAAHRLPKMRDQKSLTLHWCWFSRWGMECVASSFAYKDGQYRIDEFLPPIASPITQDASPNIVDAPIMIIVKMGQGACRFLFCPQRWPMSHLWLSATNYHSNYSMCQTKNHWCSIDAHFLMGVSALCNHVISHSISLIVFW